jgi:cysteinyl-tRNA synthetase
MAISICNSLAGRKETFETVRPGEVRMYVCGPTVYSDSHIGHLMGPVVFDTVKRYLTFRGYKVTWVLNITDIDDKIIERARETGRNWKDLARDMTRSYLGWLEKLRVTGIDEMPYCTEYIPQMIELVEGLMEKGFAYESEGDVYFSVRGFENYGRLTGRNVDDLRAGSRVAPGEHKRDPADFALWKASKPDEPWWSSPWGKGRPGWHIECSAMSTSLLGETLDIHGGGMDLKFPHHENEIAQSEAATGKPFARYWMHTGLAVIGGRKISKSDGSARLALASHLFGNYSPELLRFAVLATHYRAPLEFGHEKLVEGRKALAAFHRLFERVERTTGVSPYDRPPVDLSEEPPGGDTEIERAAADAFDRFTRAMDDDFNTAAAIGVMFDLAGAVNRAIEADDLEEQGGDDATRERVASAADVLRALGGLLGILEERPEAPAAAGLEGGLVDALVKVRNMAREKKSYEIADAVRDELARLGITLEDRPDGTTWRRSG